MSIVEIIDVPADGQLTVKIPPSLKDRSKIKLVFKDVDDDLEKKIALLEKAPFDKDFLADLEEVNNDFNSVESKVE